MIARIRLAAANKTEQKRERRGLRGRGGGGGGGGGGGKKKGNKRRSGRNRSNRTEEEEAEVAARRKQRQEERERAAALERAAYVCSVDRSIDRSIDPPPPLFFYLCFVLVSLSLLAGRTHLLTDPTKPTSNAQK